MGKLTAILKVHESQTTKKKFLNFEQQSIKSIRQEEEEKRLNDNDDEAQN